MKGSNILLQLLIFLPTWVLAGSNNPDYFLPMILNRFEGWEMKTYAGLLNAGTLNRDGSYNERNLRITGGGTISATFLRAFVAKKDLLRQPL